MLDIKAALTRKPISLDLHDCEIRKVIELNTSEFDYFVAHPLKDHDFLTQHRDMMYRDEEGAYHCLLVLGVDRPDGVLVEAEGASYARYASHFPQARAYIEREAQIFADGCPDITPNEDGTISVYLEDIENFTGAAVTADNCLARIFCEALKKSHRIAEVSGIDDYGCINITPAPEMAPDNRLRDAQLRANTLDEIIGAITDHIGSEKLYEILSQNCGCSDERISEFGFDLEDYYPAKQPEAGQDMVLQ